MQKITETFFQGVVDCNISVRVCVYSYSNIQSVTLSETKNERKTAEMYGLTISQASEESCHQTTTTIKCYEIMFNHPVTYPGVKHMNLRINNSAGENTFRFYVEAEGTY